MSERLTLTEESIEAVAARVVELLEERGPSPVRHLVDAKAVAEELGVEPGWVYEHAQQLGGQRLGDGPRPRLRFDLDVVRRHVGHGNPGAPPAEPPPKHNKRRRSSGPDLLPIKGVER